MRIPTIPVTWVVVADCARARLFVHRGPGSGLAPLSDHDSIGLGRVHGRDIAGDRPGRTFDSAGAGRHALEPPTDPKTAEKRAFLHALAGEIDKGAACHAFDRLVLVAPPAALGGLRGALAKGSRRRVDTEIGKDFSRLKDRDLVSRLGAAFRA